MLLEPASRRSLMLSSRNLHPTAAYSRRVITRSQGRHRPHNPRKKARVARRKRRIRKRGHRATGRHCMPCISPGKPALSRLLTATTFIAMKCRRNRPESIPPQSRPRTASTVRSRSARPITMWLRQCIGVAKVSLKHGHGSDSAAVIVRTMRRPLRGSEGGYWLCSVGRWTTLLFSSDTSAAHNRSPLFAK